MTTQLAFRDTQFNVVNHANQIWLTSKELAKALKYSSAKSVTDIYNKNEDEFTGAMSLVVDSTTNGINGSKRRMKVRVFSLRGAHLIAMFARTEIAKEFRRWVLDILDKNVGEPVVTPVPKSDHIQTAYKIATYFHFSTIYAAWKAQIEPALKAVNSPMAGVLDEHVEECQALIRVLTKGEERAGGYGVNGDEDFLTAARKFAEVAQKRGYMLVKVVA